MVGDKDFPKPYLIQNDWKNSNLGLKMWLGYLNCWNASHCGADDKSHTETQKTALSTLKFSFNLGVGKP